MCRTGSKRSQNGFRPSNAARLFRFPRRRRSRREFGHCAKYGSPPLAVALSPAGQLKVTTDSHARWEREKWARCSALTVRLGPESQRISRLAEAGKSALVSSTSRNEAGVKRRSEERRVGKECR